MSYYRIPADPMKDEEAARFVLRLTAWQTTPERVATRYRETAEQMRAYAVKAAKSKTGQYRGYTEAHATAQANENERRAVSVAAHVARLLAERNNPTKEA